MQKRDAVEMVKFLESQGYDAKLYEGYSGRGMYGKTTVGVTSDCRPATVDAYECDMLEDGLTLYSRYDSLGLNYIYY